MANVPIGPDQAPDYWPRWDSLFSSVHELVSEQRLLPVWRSEEHTIFEVAE